MNHEEKAWYIIHTTGLGSRGVLQVQSLFDRLGYEGLVWVPTQKSKITRYGKIQENDKPIFPSYVFVNMHIEDSALEQALIEAKIGKFLHAPGDDQYPTKISEVEMTHVKSLEELNVDPAPQELVAVEVGNLVEVCVGPMMGFKGVVIKISGHDVYIETLVFGRSASVRINASHLSKLLDSYEEKTTEN